MMQLTPQSRIFLAIEPVDFRKASMARRRVPTAPGRQPAGGRRLRLSQPLGHLAQTLAVRWPGLLALYEATLKGALFVVAQQRGRTGAPVRSELMILTWNGNPERAQMAQDWRRVA